MSSSLHHRGDIQGLRALAVLLVVLGHASVDGLEGGFVGVDVFFVVSGFLITGILLAQARDSGSISVVAFYARRTRRILPAAALTLLATEAAAFLLLNFVRAKDAVSDVLFAAAFAANFRFAEQGSDYFAQDEPPSPVLHFWSLGVEEQFYLAWPALLSLVLFGRVFSHRRRPLGRRQERRLLVAMVLLGLASLAWSIHLTDAMPPKAYFSPFTRAWELALGAALAAAAATLTRIPAPLRLGLGWLGLAAVVAAAVAFDDATPFPGAWALVPTVGTALMITAGIREEGPLGPLSYAGGASASRRRSPSGTSRRSDPYAADAANRPAARRGAAVLSATRLHAGGGDLAEHEQDLPGRPIVQPEDARRHRRLARADVDARDPAPREPGRLGRPAATASRMHTRYVDRAARPRRLPAVVPVGDSAGPAPPPARHPR